MTQRDGEGAATQRAGYWADVLRQLLRRPSFLAAAIVIGVAIAIAAAPGVVAGAFGSGDPRACELRQSAALPGLFSGHPLGFDIQGCDMWANVIYGTQTSVAIGLSVTLIATVLGCAVGLVAGFYGGAVDALLSRLVDVFFGFPFVLAAIVILTAFPHRTAFTLILVLALFAWPTSARLMRSAVLAVRGLDYVAAARAVGARGSRILLRHVLPNSVSPIIATAPLALGGIIAGEAALTFLGVGLERPAISWGLQLAIAQSYFYDHAHLLIVPAAFLSATVVAAVAAGDTLTEVLDPRRGQRP